MTRPAAPRTPHILAAAVAVALVHPAGGSAQQASARYRVLAPPLAAVGGVKADFGRKVSEQIREEIDRMPTHAPFAGRELRDALRQYELKEEELSAQECAKARQLAALLSIPLVMCGSYEAVDDGMRVEASFVSPATGDFFGVDSFTAADPEQAAKLIVREFERYVQALSSTVYCQQYVGSEQWTAALQECGKALEANPTAKTALYLRGTALWRLDSLEIALGVFEQVLALDPMNDDAYKAAGLIATQLQRRDDARRYFTEFLRLNPGDVAVRTTVAHDVARAGDPAGALRIVEDGLTSDSVDLALYEYAGRLALAAGIEAEGASCAEACEPDARSLFETAVGYFGRVFEAKGADSDSAMIGNMAVALMKLERPAEMLAFAERVDAGGVRSDANFWIARAEALKESGDLAGALASLGSAAQKDAEARVVGRRAAWLIEGGRIAEAAEPARLAVQRGELDTNLVARMIASIAYNGKAKADQHAEAIAMYEVAAGFAADAEAKAMVSFFHGYSILRQAIAVQEPGTAASARQSLPMFQRARTLIEAGGAYAGAASSRASLLSDIDAFIETQEALIRRGR